VFAAINSYFKDYRGLKKPKVLMLGADRGHAYLDTIYDTEWCTWLRSQYTDDLVEEKRTVNSPIEISLT
jgi:hypothetical protein